MAHGSKGQWCTVGITIHSRHPGTCNHILRQCANNQISRSLWLHWYKGLYLLVCHGCSFGLPRNARSRWGKYVFQAGFESWSPGHNSQLSGCCQPFCFQFGRINMNQTLKWQHALTFCPQVARRRYKATPPSWQGGLEGWWHMPLAQKLWCLWRWLPRCLPCACQYLPIGPRMLSKGVRAWLLEVWSKSIPCRWSLSQCIKTQGMWRIGSVCRRKSTWNSRISLHWLTLFWPCGSPASLG